MKKFLKNEKGFTLVELMMVIAIIAILATVLIPKMSGIKNNAKLAGVDSNARIVQGIVQGMIERYQTGATYDTFGASIVSSCSDITNPFDQNKKGGFYSQNLSNSYAVTVSKGTTDAPAANTTYAGHIFVDPTITGGAVTSVLITPYDNTGTPMPTITVEP